MKTLVTLKQNLLKSALLIFVTATSIISNGRSLTTGTITGKATSFSVVLTTSNKVDLKWSTELESNLSHFIVERSIDGKNYSDAALVFAYGTTTTRSDYVFTDNISKIQVGEVYYRISSIGSDGKSQYSDIRIVRTSK